MTDTNLPETWRGRYLDVELRWFGLPDEVSASDFAVLSNEERARSTEFAAMRRRVEYVASRARLRRSLAEVLHVPAPTIPISADDFGKPQHAGRLEFNLSHSARAVLIGWGDRPVGVDLEAAQRATTRIERLRIVAEVRNAMAVEVIAAFTLVEAATKAIGRGLAAIGKLEIDRVDSSGEIRFTSADAAAPIRAIALPLPDGYVGAVAVLD
jgi:4'-phosphopantetheinyl transferase